MSLAACSLWRNTGLVSLQPRSDDVARLRDDVLCLLRRRTSSCFASTTRSAFRSGSAFRSRSALLCARCFAPPHAMYAATSIFSRRSAPLLLLLWCLDGVDSLLVFLAFPLSYKNQPRQAQKSKKERARTKQDQVLRSNCCCLQEVGAG